MVIERKIKSQRIVETNGDSTAGFVYSVACGLECEPAARIRIISAGQLIDQFGPIFCSKIIHDGLKYR